MARDAYNGELSAVKSEYKKQQNDPKLKIKVKCCSCDSKINQFVLLRSGKLSERKFCSKCWKVKNEKSKTKQESSEDSESVDETSALLFVEALHQKKSNTRACSFSNKQQKTNPAVVGDINTVNHKGSTAVVLSHHISNQNRGRLQRSAEKQPTLHLKISPCATMYDDLNIPAPNVQPSSMVSGYADTCAQSCLGGMTVFYKCGLKKKQLIPVKYKMQVANRELLDIQGAVFLNLEVCDQSTKAMVYVSPDVQGLYVSKQCLKELNVVSKHFPLPGEHSEVSTVHENSDGASF